MARYELTDADKRDLTKLISEGKALPVMLRVTKLPRRIEWGKKK